MLIFISVSIRDSKFLDLLQEKKKNVYGTHHKRVFGDDQSSTTKSKGEQLQQHCYICSLFFFDSYYLISLVVTV